MRHSRHVRDAGYRSFIDRLVHSCLEGQGQIAPDRARSGLWNQNATPDRPLDGQYSINQLLASLAPPDREVLAGLLAEVFQGGVHEVLVALHEAGIEPFSDGYEGTPAFDFAGRLLGLPWPEID